MSSNDRVIIFDTTLRDGEQSPGAFMTEENLLVLTVDGNECPASGRSPGPVDATFKAIESVANSGPTLQLYSLNAITKGTDSQGEITVRLEKGGRIGNGNGADTDIVVASAKAYALNLMQVGVKAHPQVVGV